MSEQIEPCPNLAGIRVEGSTIYEMNARGDRRLWSATVCPGTHANGVRMASIQTVSIAEGIARAVREAQEQRERAEAAEAKLADAAAIIRKLAWLLGRSRDDTDAPAHAKEWLRKNGLSGNVLRDLPAPEGEKG